ncbi:hypothetical protein FHS95_002403 [Sphingomonas naasensis]|uniref:Uncharacterized protein n=1 Tax=Sphingomonas naasensis TaxID=1344951 RepID=A0A4S1WPF6_9SPHN|nr:hypothetical protein [Sphingomonas naasensis]NIJ20711.1 hypothetical protein [Sphingomonas naasensis]TGX43126.1 hypothetical protein E5A74_08060 [Sphingomonas naasensis]
MAVTGDLQPLLVLFVFVPSLLAGAICAGLVTVMARFTRLDAGRAQSFVATCWWVLLSAGLWIGCDWLMQTGKADNGASFAAILLWIFVVLPAPILGAWILRLRPARGGGQG